MVAPVSSRAIARMQDEIEYSMRNVAFLTTSVHNDHALDTVFLVVVDEATSERKAQSQHIKSEQAQRDRQRHTAQERVNRTNFHTTYAHKRNTQ
mmetsp:Transcript_10737/g.29618  ORF Transcript_10737/g.29618 Transcript_10737/m.29618 type:complete len:94 (-) Transcript_10737:1871-2152(-)